MIDQTRPSRRRPLALMAVVAALAVLAIACSSSKKASTATAGTAVTSTTAATTGTGSSGSSASGSLAVATTSLGTVVVDAQGMTLYQYRKDTGPTSTCTGGCATAWPPAIVTGPPSGGAGVTGTVTVTTRPDGSTQLVLAGHPLYRFAGDSKPGDVNGQGVGSVWNATGPDGQPVG